MNDDTCRRYVIRCMRHELKVQFKLETEDAIARIINNNGDTDKNVIKTQKETPTKT